MDQLLEQQQTACDMGIPSTGRLDVVHQFLELQQVLPDGPRILVGLRLGDYPTLVDAHLDELVGLLVDEELLHRQQK